MLDPFFWYQVKTSQKIAEVIELGYLTAAEGSIKHFTL